MPVKELYFARTRPIVFQDFATLKSLLAARGYSVAALDRVEGGIAFLTDGEDVGKDLRFHMFGSKTYLPRAVDGEFVDDLSQVWAKSKQPVWHIDNVFFVRAKGEFTDQELMDVRADVVTALGAADNVIANEGRSILPEDSVENTRLFLNFDRATAIKKWTLPEPDFPDKESERLFKCWKCLELYPHWHFRISEQFLCDEYNGMTDFETLLSRYEVYGHIPWCDNCQRRGFLTRATKKLRCD